MLLRKKVPLLLTFLIFLCLFYLSLVYSTWNSSTGIKYTTAFQTRKRSVWDDCLLKVACKNSTMYPSYFQDFLNDHQSYWNQMSPTIIAKHQAELLSFIHGLEVENIVQSFQGRAILYAVYPRVLREVLISMTMLREHGCELPIELWHYNELSNDNIKLLMQVKNVTVQNLSSFAKLHLTSGFQMKGASLLYTSYDEVLFLDSDNIPARDPTFLFDTPAFKETGTLFWKDFWKTTSYNPIWSLTNITCIDEFEQESGQVLVRRTSPGVYQSLKLAFYMQKNSDLYFELVLGDKDTFRFAWRLLKTPFHFVRPNIGVAGNEDCNYVMVQFGPFWSRKVHGLPPKGYVERPEPQIAFLHMNLLKYKPFRNNPEFSFITTYANVIVPNGRAEFGGLCTKLHEFTEKGRSYKTKRIRFDRALPGFSALYQKVANRIGDV